jgi:hypothetical protein
VDGVRLVLEESRCHAKDPPLHGSVSFRFPQAQVLSRSMMMCCSKECPSWLSASILPTVDYFRSTLPADISAGPAFVGTGQKQAHAAQQKRGFCPITSSARAHSGNPALRRPSINSFECEFDAPPRAIKAEIVTAGSSSSTRATASRASASRPRWAKADASLR